MKKGKRIDLEQYAKHTHQAEAVFTGSLHKVMNAMSGKEAVTDLTKMAVSVIGAFSRIKAAEIHRMGLEIQVEKMVMGLVSTGLEPNEEN